MEYSSQIIFKYDISNDDNFNKYQIDKIDKYKKRNIYKLMIEYINLNKNIIFHQIVNPLCGRNPEYRFSCNEIWLVNKNEIKDNHNEYYNNFNHLNVNKFHELWDKPDNKKWHNFIESKIEYYKIEMSKETYDIDDIKSNKFSFTCVHQKRKKYKFRFSDYLDEHKEISPRPIDRFGLLYNRYEHICKEYERYQNFIKEFKNKKEESIKKREEQIKLNQENTKKIKQQKELIKIKSEHQNKLTQEKIKKIEDENENLKIKLEEQNKLIQSLLDNITNIKDEIIELKNDNNSK